MKLKLDITTDLVAAMAAEVLAGEKAVTAAMREVGTGLKSSWRGQRAIGLGRRLANSIRSQTYPKAGESLNAAALVWSKAPVIVGAHDTGPLIRANDGFYPSRLKPQDAACARAGSPPVNGTPPWSAPAPSIAARVRACWWRRDAERPEAGVASRSKTCQAPTVPIFLLVPQVNLPKRLNLERDAERRSTACRG